MNLFSATLKLYMLAAAAVAPLLSSSTDEALMAAYSGGDARAFEVLYTRHRGPFWRYLSRLIGTSAEGEELFQDAWQRVITARESYNPDSPFRAWLFRIGHNLAMDRLRHRKIAPESSIDDHVLQFPGASESEPDQQSISLESHQRLMQSLAELPEEQRNVVLLRAEGDLSLEEIGKLTGEGRETVKSRLRYALAKLKQSLS